jgi:hypothetical protein
MISEGPNDLFIEDGESLSSIIERIGQKWPGATLDHCKIEHNDWFEKMIVKLVSPP